MSKLLHRLDVALEDHLGLGGDLHRAVDAVFEELMHCGVLRVPSGSRVHGNLTGVALPAVVGTADWYRGTQCLYTDTNTPATLSPAFG